MRRYFLLGTLIVTVSLSILGWYVNEGYWWALAAISPVILLGLYDSIQTRHTIQRNFPVVGHLRFLLEEIRPEIGQYFIETDLDGRPFSRRQRSIVYQRAKREMETVPFGTQLDTRSHGYEFIAHSLFPKKFKDPHPRVRVGGPDCKFPYRASVLNISAMSFGSLSRNAIMALNKGADRGDFAHNTGEGGISPYHLLGGDLIWQIGTGYFGCRTKGGEFNKEEFQIEAARPEVKMIELKLSQGAKPGRGGILPGGKNSPEVAKVRKIDPWIDVHSPPNHKEFSDNDGLVKFIGRLRELSGGKPIGIKLCLGDPQEFEDLCIAIGKIGIKPDFITVDGSEGGTGAALLEFSDAIGMPLYEGLSHIDDTLKRHGLRREVKVIAAGKVITGFDMVKIFALGADICNSARAMMMATGCIQALRCNTGKCPTGVATQNEQLVKGLVVEDKYKRVANYHRGTVHAAVEIAEACGFSRFDDIKRKHIMVREDGTVRSYEEIYPVEVEAEELKVKEG